MFRLIVRDMRYDLNGFTQIVPSAFFFDNALVYPAGSYIIGTGSLDSGETFVMS